MNQVYLTIIQSIESEISYEYLPGAIRWADDNCDGAWSRAIDRFDLALSEIYSPNFERKIKFEAEQYKRTVLGLLKKFKEHKRINDVDSFLNSISVGA